MLRIYYGRRTVLYLLISVDKFAYLCLLPNPRHFEDLWSDILALFLYFCGYAALLSILDMLMNICFSLSFLVIGKLVLDSRKHYLYYNILLYVLQNLLILYSELQSSNF